MSNTENTTKAYIEIFALLNKYKDITDFDIDRLEDNADLHIYKLELIDLGFKGLEKKKLEDRDWSRIGEHITIGVWDGERRKISWSDDNTQPTGETLMSISFGTGAYIFGSDYPKEIFNNFWDELKTYNPKFVDSNNSSLYFGLENASVVYNEFNAIFNKYIELNKVDVKKREIEKLEKKLVQLKDNE